MRVMDKHGRKIFVNVVQSDDIIARTEARLVNDTEEEGINIPLSLAAGRESTDRSTFLRLFPLCRLLAHSFFFRVGGDPCLIFDVAVNQSLCSRRIRTTKRGCF